MVYRETPGEAGPVSGPPKVLIVDDEPEVLESTALLVESLGYDVILLDDPAKIIETAEREHPGVLLQDIRMPDLNLAGLVATLRSNPGTEDLPLVFFSAGGDLQTLAARYDAWGYISKPFGREELAGLLERVLGAAVRPGGFPTGRDPEREVRTLFHDHWNLIAALSNYTQILDSMQDLPPRAQRSVRGLGEALLKLESKTERLRAYIMGIVTALEVIEEGEEDDTEKESQDTRRSGQEPRTRRR